MARGILRIYLGAAPGVGKTFAMLEEAHRRKGRGTDIVVGFVETHGREHTAALLEGLEVVPRRTLTYRGTSFTEMDVDAVLARRPQVALVDELAHTNVPGSRNAKRWQDIQELLDAGITVLSTVNIQHLESLNDVVEQITGVKQRETVPDEFVRRADQVELVDMAPEALRRRMVHGNVYPPEKVDAALGNYFRVGNLTALRELALLWLADKVDEQLDRYRAEHKHRRHLGDPGTGRGRAHRRPRGGHPDPPGGADRRPDQRRRPAGRARRPVRRAVRRRPRAAGQAAGAGGEPRRHLPPGHRRRRPECADRLRPRRQRHPARARRQPPQPARPDHLRRGRCHRPPTCPARSTCTWSPTNEVRQGRLRPSVGSSPLSRRRRLAGFGLALFGFPLLALGAHLAPGSPVAGQRRSCCSSAAWSAVALVGGMWPAIARCGRWASCC